MEGLILVLILIGLYFLPGIVASARGAKNAAPVWVIDIFLGWSLIGWVVALAMAFGQTKEEAERARTVIISSTAPMAPGGPTPSLMEPEATPVAAGVGSRYCTSCGSPAGTGKFCGNCGASLATVENPSNLV